MLWVQQVKEAIWKFTAWNSLTRMSAGGLVVDIASAPFSVCKIESYHTSPSGLPGRPSSLGTDPVRTPRAGAGQASGSRGPAAYPDG